MSSCIYDDAPAVTICPGCDFSICQECLDGGIDGVCKTCAEERTDRQANSAIQREYTVEVQARRCNYCRAAEDESTTLDDEGYCDACRALPRCIAHADLIAVGHCKTCRREFCRKCLGFTDVCQECTAKNKTKPLKEKAPSAAAAPKGGKAGAGKKAKKTTPIEEPAAGKGKGTKGRTKPLPDEKDKDGKDKKPKEKKPSRGQAAMLEKMTKKNEGRTRSQLIVAASILALGILVLVSGMYMHAMSPEEQNRRLRDQMIGVHKGVVHYYKKNGRLPKSEDDIRAAMDEANVKGGSKINISTGGAAPSAVVYKLTKAGFVIQGTNARGQVMEDPPGTPFVLDQYYDSSAL